VTRVCIDVDLEEIRTTDLIEELRRRRKLTKEDIMNLSPEGIVDILEELGCPQSIIKLVEDWARQPVADVHKLMRWNEACGTAS